MDAFKEVDQDADKVLTRTEVKKKLEACGSTAVVMIELAVALKVFVRCDQSGVAVVSGERTFETVL